MFQICSIRSEGCAAIGCTKALSWQWAGEVAFTEFQEKEAEIINMCKSRMMYHFCCHGDVIVTAVCLLFFSVHHC